MRIISHFSISFSLLLTLMLLVGTVVAGCTDKDRDVNSGMAQKVDVYVDVGTVELDYDELYAQFAESASAKNGDEENGGLHRLDVDESGKALLAEQVPVGSLLRFKLLFLMADGTEVGCYDKLSEGVLVTEDDGSHCTIAIDNVTLPSPGPSPTPSASPSPTPSPSSSPSPSPSSSPTPSPSPSPSSDPVDVYLKVEGDLPDMGQISVRCSGWSEDLAPSVPVTFDANGVTTEPIAVNRHGGDRLQLGVYFEQQEDWVYFDGYNWDDEEYYWQSVFYYENYKHEGTGVIVPEATGGKSVVAIKFSDFRIVADTLITYDLSGIENDWWDTEEYQPNFILLAVHEDGNFNSGPKSMRIPLRKKGSGFAPVYLRAATPGVQYKGYYALVHLNVDANGDVIFDDYGQATCTPIVNNRDSASVLLPTGQTQMTIELKTTDFS